MSLILYQFPLSHFCEKIRWALDYKHLPYHTKNLLPGLHIKTTTKLVSGSSVPVLEHDGKYIQDSGKIITYLDEQFSERKLTPVNAQERQAAMEWERYLDSEVGIHVRRYLYYTLLQHPKLVTGFLSTGGPFWAKPFLRLIFPKLKSRMRRYMDINETTAAQSKQTIEKALRRINEAVADKHYLVGNRFSRADLSAAALLAPLFMPPQYGLNWPQSLPEPLRSELAAMDSELAWAKQVYAEHR